MTSSQNWRDVDFGTLKDTLKSTHWVMVEFWAPDCVFSRLFAPVREHLAQRYNGRMDLVRCCIHLGNDELDQRWGIWALPAMLLLHDGRPTRRWIGAAHSCAVLQGVETALTRSM